MLVAASAAMLTRHKFFPFGCVTTRGSPGRIIALPPASPSLAIPEPWRFCVRKEACATSPPGVGSVPSVLKLNCACIRPGTTDRVAARKIVFTCMFAPWFSIQSRAVNRPGRTLPESKRDRLLMRPRKPCGGFVIANHLSTKSGENCRLRTGTFATHGRLFRLQVQS